MTHKIVHIKASKKQLSKLRNGHKVRISPSQLGEGFHLIVHPERYDQVSRTFQKGKGMEIQLTPEELMVNKEQTPHLEGRGIFGDKFDRFVEKTIGKKSKDKLYKGAEILKIPIKKGLDKLAEYAPQIGATAMSGLTTATGNPELIPLAGAFGSQIGSYLGKNGSKIAKDYLDHPSTYQKKLTSNAGGTRNKVAPATLAGQVAQNHIFDNLNNELGTNYGNLAKAGLQNHIAHMKRADMDTDAFRREELFGDGLHKHHREVASVGKHSSFVGSQHHLPPALVSQPFSANFQFQHTLPPAYQKFSKGGGLYA